MIVGHVVGQLIATRKHEAYQGQKLLLVQPVNLNDQPIGELVLAIDGVDAGAGDRVLLVRDGWSVAHILGQFHAPVDAAVTGVIDQIHIGGLAS